MTSKRLCRGGNPSAGGAAAAKRYIEPLHMVWVIQRDFLQGKSTQASLEEALAPVPNPKADDSIQQVPPAVILSGRMHIHGYMAVAGAHMCVRLQCWPDKHLQSVHEPWRACAYRWYRLQHCDSCGMARTHLERNRRAVACLQAARLQQGGHLLLKPIRQHGRYLFCTDVCSTSTDSCSACKCRDNLRHHFHAHLHKVVRYQSVRAAAQVNNIRTSIKALANNSVAFGLPQPHLDRTRLCELPDSELNPAYLSHREALRDHLHSTARAKTVRGAQLTGAGLANLIVALVDALNARELPTSGSMLETFNEQLLRSCAEAHATALRALSLPLRMVRASEPASASGP